MGCGASAGPHGLRPMPADGKPVGPEELQVQECEESLYKPSPDDCYVLNQSFCIVRHAERLDHTDAWKTAPERLAYPNDTPLTAKGHKTATATGELLKSTGTKWGLIVASPYLRCAQTASRIAEVLKLPIHFDLDIGEIFDAVSMKGDICGAPQHRDATVLGGVLKKQFPDVEYVRDDKGEIRIEGKLPPFPEDFGSARMRYCYKTYKLVQRAAKELMSIILITHGDGVAAVVNLLRENWKIGKVPYTSYAYCTRQVQVFDRSTNARTGDLPVFVEPQLWNLQISNGFEVSKQKLSKDKEAAKHEHHLEEMEHVGKAISTDYQLAPEVVNDFNMNPNLTDQAQASIQGTLQALGTSSSLEDDGEMKMMKMRTDATQGERFGAPHCERDLS